MPKAVSSVCLMVGRSVAATEYQTDIHSVDLTAESLARMSVDLTVGSTVGPRAAWLVLTMVGSSADMKAASWGCCSAAYSVGGSAVQMVECSVGGKAATTVWRKAWLHPS